MLSEMIFQFELSLGLSAYTGAIHRVSIFGTGLLLNGFLLQEKDWVVVMSQRRFSRSNRIEEEQRRGEVVALVILS